MASTTTTTTTTTTINFRIDKQTKKDMERVCKELGMSMTTALTIFVKKVGREHKIPFEVSVDPFYSEENVAELERRYNDLKSGKSKLEEHALIEV